MTHWENRLEERK